MGKKEEILQLLKETGGYVSGQDLCQRFQVSRTAIWKQIRKLKEEGYPIEATNNRGYRLLPLETDILNGEQIAEKLQTAWVGHPLVYTARTGSTNDDIFDLAARGYPHGTLAVASCQTAGKGRRGRPWESASEDNVYMSILLKPDIPPALTPMLTIVMALSVYQASLDLLAADPGPASAAPLPPNLARPQPAPAPGNSPAQDTAASPAAPESASPPPREAPSARFGIKWPNDIVATTDGTTYKKLCGILTEMRMEDNEISAITIGIGLNINQTDFPDDIARIATSYALALGRPLGRAALAASVWNHFEKNYETFVRDRSFFGLRPAYEEGLVNRNRPVHVLDPRQPFTGIALGIDDRGELQVRPDGGGPVRSIGSGEVSVRGVAGYV